MTRRSIGQSCYQAGLSAEGQVASHYARAGYRLAAQRWRGLGGEIDLIVERDGEVVFVEVKQSRTFARAATRITPRQQMRICSAAEEYLGTLPKGALTPSRVDAAFVNSMGVVQILENAIQAG